MSNPDEAETQRQAVILFADVAGSTQMYEKLGDQVAFSCISESLNRIALHVEQFNGRVIEIIGDEAMVLFDTPTDAVQASIAIQQSFFSHPVVDSIFTQVRIGFHMGPVNITGDRVYGDTINVAARVVALCDADCIVATIETLEAADIGPMKTRPYQTTRVKGKTEALVLSEVVLDAEDATALMGRTHFKVLRQTGVRLQLTYNDQRWVVEPDQSSFTLGRAMDCDLVVESSEASRKHASFEFNSGEVELRDHSTNGSYIYEGEGDTISDVLLVTRLHRAKQALRGSGQISFGIPIEKSEPSSRLLYELLAESEPVVQDPLNEEGPVLEP